MMKRRPGNPGARGPFRATPRPRVVVGRLDGCAVENVDAASVETLGDAQALPVARPPVEMLVGHLRGDRVPGTVGRIDVVEKLLKVGWKSEQCLILCKKKDEAK